METESGGSERPGQCGIADGASTRQRLSRTWLLACRAPTLGWRRSRPKPLLRILRSGVRLLRLLIMNSKLHQTKNDLHEKTRRTMIELLNQHLADVLDLRLQAKQAHWNLKGPHFIALHELLDKIADGVEEFSDDIAERAVALRPSRWERLRSFRNTPDSQLILSIQSRAKRISKACRTGLRSLAKPRAPP